MTSMLLPWLGFAALHGMRPAVVTFDHEAVSALLTGTAPTREGTRVLRIGARNAPDTPPDLWPESTAFTLRQRGAGPDDKPIRATLHTPAGGGAALAHGIFVNGRDTIRRILSRNAPGGDGRVLTAELNEVLGPGVVNTVAWSRGVEEPSSPGDWTWPPEAPGGARGGVLTDRVHATGRNQIQVWDMGDETWPIGFQTLALTLAPFPIHQRRETVGRVEVAGDAGYGLWLTDGRLVVGVVTDGRGKPEEMLAGLPYVTSIGSRSPLAGLYAFYDGHTTGVLLTAILVFLVLWLLGVLRATSWAGARVACEGREREEAGELRDALADLGDLFSVSDTDLGRMEFGWRLQDPRVQEALGARPEGVGHTSSLVLELDEGSGTARGQERRIRILWMGTGSEGALEASVLSSAASGVDFIDRGQGSVGPPAGGGDGPPDLRPAALKAAVSRVIVDAGWTYRPVLSFSRWISG